MIQQQDIVNQARSWIGTRFHHQGRVKQTVCDHGGCDCLGLIVGVCEELKLASPVVPHLQIASFDEHNYPRMPDGQRLLQSLMMILPMKDPSEMVAGDVILCKIEDLPQHVGILSDYGDELGVIHAYAPARKVVEHRLDAMWREKIVAVFSLV